MAKFKVNWPEVKIELQRWEQFAANKGAPHGNNNDLYQSFGERFPPNRTMPTKHPALSITPEQIQHPVMNGPVPPHLAGFFYDQLEKSRIAAVDAKERRRLEQYHRDLADDFQRAILREQQALKQYFSKKMIQQLAYTDYREILMARSLRQTEYIAKKSDQHVVERHIEQGKMWEEIHLKKGGYLPSQLPPQNQQDGNTLADNLLEKAIREKANWQANLRNLLPLTAGQALAVFQMIGYNVATRAPGVSNNETPQDLDAQNNRVTSVKGSSAAKI